MVLFTLIPFGGRVRALPPFVIVEGLGSPWSRIAAGAGVRVRLNPCLHARALVADRRRGMGAQLDEHRTLGLTAPDFEGVRLDAK